MRSTIKDVARITDLSIATISKFLNGGNVLEENRIRIAAAIKDLDFHVNQAARGLKKNRTMLIGVIVHNFESRFFMHLLSHIENSLMRAGYSTVICDSRQDPKLETSKIRFLRGKNVDGIILMPASHNVALYRSVIESGTPMVFLDRIVEGIECDSVLSDNRQAAKVAIESFICKGHKRIGLVNMAGRTLYTAEERHRGYAVALEEGGLPYDAGLVATGAISIDGGYEAMTRLLQIEDRPTAVLVTNDDMALGAYKAINESGLHIPQDISIIGFDVYDIATVLQPGLSVVEQPLRQLGETAAEVLLKRIDSGGPQAVTAVQLKTELILRGSCI